MGVDGFGGEIELDERIGREEVSIYTHERITCFVTWALSV